VTENLDLIKKAEKEGETLLEKTDQQCKQILEEARQKANKILAEAQESRPHSRLNLDNEMQQISRDTQKKIKELWSRAEKNKEKAVEMIVSYVLGDTSV
jgi:vacuolar-type H+-ATPase subunit H